MGNLVTSISKVMRAGTSKRDPKRGEIRDKEEAEEDTGWADAAVLSASEGDGLEVTRVGICSLVFPLWDLTLAFKILSPNRRSLTKRNEAKRKQRKRKEERNEYNENDDQE